MRGTFAPPGHADATAREKGTSHIVFVRVFLKAVLALQYPMHASETNRCLLQVLRTKEARIVLYCIAV